MSESDEFSTMATWTADSVERLGCEHALPAACRGSGTPAALRWLWQHLDVRSGSTLLDAGAGIGGPAALAARETGADVMLVDPMAAACEAAERLFGLAATVADASALPVADHSYDSAWALGVLCTLDDQPGALRELVRVVRSGGCVGLLVFVRTVRRLPVETPNNDFPTWRELRTMLDEAGLNVVDENRLDDFPETDTGWTASADLVRDDVRRNHCGDPRWQRADAEERLVGDLLERGLVEGVVVAARAQG